MVPDVLIVDDEPGMREILESVCELIDVPCRCSIHGADALEQIGKKEPALILLDLMMPVMGGQELLVHLKGTPKTAKIPVIIFTAASLSTAQREALPVPDSMILLKPAMGLEDIQQAIIEGLKQAT